MLDLNLLSDYVFQGDILKVREFTENALADDIQPEEILKKGLLEGMKTVGIHFKNNDIFLPEVMQSSQAMNAGMKILQPLLTRSGTKPLARVIIGTVKGDLHDIGKNIVTMMLKGGGFEVIDLGIDVSSEKFLSATKKYQPEILGMSAMLTTTMMGMKETIDAFEKENLRKQIKIIIGGTAITDNFAKEIGADGYAPDAVSAVNMAKGFLSENSKDIEGRTIVC